MYGCCSRCGKGLGIRSRVMGRVGKGKGELCEAEGWEDEIRRVEWKDGAND